MSRLLRVAASASPFFHPPSDQNEVVSCQKRPCPVQCSHPVPSDTCCPVCDSCLYKGVVHTHGRAFTLSSNPCERCTCAGGTVTCAPVVCPQTPCLRPVTEPGQCCPVCRGNSGLLCNLLIIIIITNSPCNSSVLTSVQTGWTGVQRRADVDPESEPLLHLYLSGLAQLISSLHSHLSLCFGG